MASLYAKGTNVWHPDATEGWMAATVEDAVVNGDKFSVKLKLANGEEKTVEAKTSAFDDPNDNTLPPLANPPIIEAADDLTSLSHLNEPAVLQAIKLRYLRQSIYTYSGIVLIAANPFYRLDYLYDSSMIQGYAGKRREDQEPHLFAIAEEAYRKMLRDNANQTIVVSGESGAGKTVSAKHIMRYFATVEDPDRPDKKRETKNKGSSGMSKTEEEILATNPIMEAFGNAKTTRNDNSSRFGKYIEIMFDKATNIIGAKIRIYLLERSRLVYQPATERNYHIFYQLCVGATQEERDELGLLPIEDFFYLNQGGDPVIPGVDDAAEFKLTRNALTSVSVDDEAQKEIWKVLAALLHLGNVTIGGTNAATLSATEPSLAKAAQLLGVDTSQFAKWTTKKQRITGGDKIMSDLTPKQALVVKDSVAKFIYSSLFDWLVVTINNRLAPAEILDQIKCFIGVLDIYGFEHFKRNSFEQFCINYANEKLQQSFNQHVFKLEQEEYVREEIDWTFIDFSDNQPCIDLIEGKLGILSLLDEESRLLGGSDNSMVIKLEQNFASGKFEKFFKKARFGKSTFTVCHYAVDVTYDSEGFIEKNRDTVPDEHMEVIHASSNEFLTAVIKTSAKVRDKTPDAPDTPKKAATPAPLAPGLPGRRAPAGAAQKKPTLGGIFKLSLIDLMQTIQSTDVHYIRCIKPNEAKEAWKFEGPMVLSQLRACGVLETVRISCAGYPTRWTYEEFASRYYMLVHSSQWVGVKEMGLSVLEKTIPEKDKYQLGKTKIFFRAGMLAYLENLRTRRLNECAIMIQKNLRMKYYQKKYLQARTAILAVQARSRGYMTRIRAQEARRIMAATTIQRVWRGQKQRKKFLAIRKSVIRFQALCKGRLTRAHILETRYENAARTIQRTYRSRQSIRKWRQYRRKIVIIQSLWRKKQAKKEYRKLREEARSVDNLKQVSYRLENKVVELTQTLQRRTEEKKALESQVESLESQLKVWRTKANTSEANQREAQVEVNQFHALSARLPILEGELKTALAQFEESEANSKRLQEDAKQLRDSLAASKAELDKSISRFKDQETENMSLREQIAVLEDELSNRGPPVAGENGNVASKLNNGLINLVSAKRPKRRSYEDTTTALPDDYDRFRNYQARPASMAVQPAGGQARRGVSPSSNNKFGFSTLLEDPDNVSHILEDETGLNEEVSFGLIRDLKIPQPSSQNPAEEKEVLFPAYLINLVTSEMWHNGFVKESERFLATVMQNVQQEVMRNHTGDEAINLGAFWLSNVHEMLSFVFLAEDWYEAQKSDDYEYDRLLEVVKHDLESLEFNIYHTWMKGLKRKLQKMIVPAIIESQSLPGFVTNDGNRFFNRILQSSNTPAFSMDDLLSLFNKVYKALKAYYLEDTIITQAITELLKLVGVTAFNDLLLRRNFLSWKRGLQINYNITRIEEWCKSHDMPEGVLQLEHLMQATKLLQLKKATLNDIEIIQDICWMLSPQQIQKLLNQYLVADYEQPINGEIMKAVEKRAITEKSDVLLLAPIDLDDSGPYEIAEPRQITALETYLPSWLPLPRLRRLTEIVSAQAIAQQEKEAKEAAKSTDGKSPNFTDLTGIA